MKAGAQMLQRLSNGSQNVSPTALSQVEAGAQMLQVFESVGAEHLTQVVCVCESR